MKKFEIKVIYKNGYSIQVIESTSFAKACAAIGDGEQPFGQEITGFELVDHSKMSMVFEPVAQGHDLRFCIQED